MGGGIANFTNVAATFKVILISVINHCSVEPGFILFENTVDPVQLVECLTQKGGTAGSSLTGVTALCP